jgi:hypothetical protein
MYLIPVPGNGNTIAKNSKICSSRYISMFFGCDQFLLTVFYVGWAFAVVLILGGIFAKKEL